MQACGDELEGLLAEGGAGNLSDIEVLSFMRTLHFLVDVERPQVIIIIRAKASTILIFITI